jgi:DNA-binding MarR family transcriptional regulator
MIEDELDLQILENAMRLFFRAFKSPAYWEQVGGHSKITIDRLAAAILQVLTFKQVESSSVQDLANFLRVEAPSITRKTQELEGVGLLVRAHNQSDKRVTHLVVTEKGKKVAEMIIGAQKETIKNTFKLWSKEDKHNLIALFDKFSQDFNANISQRQMIKKGKI